MTSTRRTKRVAHRGALNQRPIGSAIIAAVAPTALRRTEAQLIALGLYPDQASVLLRHVNDAGVADEIARWIARGLSPLEASVYCRHHYGGPGNVLHHDEDGTYFWDYRTVDVGSGDDDDSRDGLVPVAALERIAIASLMQKEILEIDHEGFFLDLEESSREIPIDAGQSR